MVEWISNWAGAIVVAVIIATIIEMIIPEGNSKKYIKIVVGIYILFTIVSPVISDFTGKSIAVSDIIDLDEYIEKTEKSSKLNNTLGNNNEENIREIYIDTLKNDIKTKVEGKEYSVENIKVDIANDENYTINSITLNVSKLEEKNTNKVEEIQKVNTVEIEIQKSETNDNEINKDKELSKSQKNKLKEYLSSVYEIPEKNIHII